MVATLAREIFSAWKRDALGRSEGGLEGLTSQRGEARGVGERGSKTENVTGKVTP